MKRLFLGTLFTIGAGLGLVTAQSLVPPAGTIERLDPALDDILDTNATLTVIRQDYFGANEGAAWIRQGNYLVFSDMGANRIYKWDPATKQLSVLLEKSGFSGTDITQVRVLHNGRLMVAVLGSNGIAVDREGRLVFCTHGDRSIVRLEKDGKRTTLVDRYEGKRLNGPNDLVVRSDGSIYFSDLGAGLRGGAATSPDRELDFQGAFRWKPDGSVQLVTKTMTNGIAFSPDEKYAYTTGAGVLRYEVQPDGTFANAKKFVENRQADGIRVDSHGFVYSSHGWIANPDGKVIGTIKLPDGDNPTSLAFGDADGRGLYFTTLRSVYYVRLKRSGW